jgi:hypothetical protein
MVSKLRVLAGPSPDDMEPITDLVNSGRTYDIRSDAFEGRMVVEIKGFVPEGAAAPSEAKDYFCRPDRKGVTWSIQVQGAHIATLSDGGSVLTCVVLRQISADAFCR